MIANVFLIVNGLTHAFSFFDTTRMEEIIQAFRDFLEGISPNLSWIADVYSWFVSIFENFSLSVIALDSLSVTCEGSQAPAKLLANVLVILLVILIFETHVFPFVNISIQASSRVIKAYLKERKYPTLLVAVATNSALILLFLFKYLIQLLQGLTAVSDFLPYHSTTQPVCGSADKILRGLGTAFFWVLLFVAVHVLLRTFVWGMPEGITFRSADPYMPNWIKVICCYNETSHLKTEEFFTKQRGIRTHLNDQERDEVPSFADIVVLAMVDAKHGNAKTLKDYTKTMVWKWVQLVKMTLGIWDGSLIKSMEIKEMADVYDDDKTDDEKYHQEMICLTGQTHCLVWQFAPALVAVSKFGEASHFAPIYAAGSVEMDPLLGSKELKWWDGKNLMKKLANFVWKLKSVVGSRLFTWLTHMVKFACVLALCLAPKAIFIAISALISFPAHAFESLERLIELGII